MLSFSGGMVAAHQSYMERLVVAISTVSLGISVPAFGDPCPGNPVSTLSRVAEAIDGAAATAEMPIIWTRLAIYDEDKSNSLSAVELEGMPDDDVADLFFYGVDPGDGGSEYSSAANTVSAAHAWSVLRKLSCSKRARSLTQGMSDELESYYFRNIYATDPDCALLALRVVKPSAAQADYGVTEGTGALSLLNSLDPDARADLVKRLAEVDPGYQANLETMSAMLARKEWPTGITSTETHPTPQADRVRETSFDAKGTPEVMQLEYLVTDATVHSAIQTFGAGPCVILTLYDPQKQLGAMAHFDARTAKESVDRLIQEFTLRGTHPTNIEARLVGGYPGMSEELVYNLRKRLTEERIPIVEQDVLRSPDSSASIQLDVTTGEITDYDEAVHTTPNDIFQSKIDRVVEADRPAFLYRHSDSLPSVGVLTARPPKRPD